MDLPTNFRKNIQDLFPEQANLLFDSLKEPPTISIRLNPGKQVSLKTLEKTSPTSLKYTPIPWCNYGYFLDK